MKLRFVLVVVAIYAVLGLGQVLPQVPPPIAGAVQAAQVDINSATEDELKQLEAEKKAVFVSECNLRTVQGGKATLVFPVGEKEGLYIERDEKTIVNSASVSLEGGRWHMQEVASGGDFTVKMVSYLVSELLTYPFGLVMSEQTMAIAKSRPYRGCEEKLPE